LWKRFHLTGHDTRGNKTFAAIHDNHGGSGRDSVTRGARSGAAGTANDN
jgi:hypothetical protein